MASSKQDIHDWRPPEHWYLRGFKVTEFLKESGDLQKDLELIRR
jgi:hypothetical protein